MIGLMSSGGARNSATKARTKRAKTVTIATLGLTVTARLHGQLSRPHPARLDAVRHAPSTDVVCGPRQR
jgi:hypothetical protein